MRPRGAAVASAPGGNRGPGGRPPPPSRRLCPGRCRGHCWPLGGGPPASVCPVPPPPNTHFALDFIDFSAAPANWGLRAAERRRGHPSSASPSRLRANGRFPKTYFCVFIPKTGGKKIREPEWGEQGAGGAGDLRPQAPFFSQGSFLFFLLFFLLFFSPKERLEDLRAQIWH